MPTYEYECQECGIHFDEFQRMSDPLIRKCPKCGGRVHRIISGGAGLIFKGTGFYITDYKKSESTDLNKNPVLKKSDEKAGSASDKKDEKKSGESNTKTEKGSKSDETKKTTDKKTESKNTKENK
jgi:putative FmdB family regulatory protein